MTAGSGSRPVRTAERVFLLCVVLSLAGLGRCGQTCALDEEGGGTKSTYCDHGCCGSVVDHSRGCCPDESGPSTAVIVAAVCGSLAAIVIVVICMYFCSKKEKTSNSGRSSRVTPSSASRRRDRQTRGRGVSVVQVTGATTREQPHNLTHAQLRPPPSYSSAGQYPPGPGPFSPPPYVPSNHHDHQGPEPEPSGSQSRPPSYRTARAHRHESTAQAQAQAPPSYHTHNMLAPRSPPPAYSQGRSTVSNIRTTNHNNMQGNASGMPSVE